MAQTGFTPIQIYSSSTAAAAPTAGNLTNSTLGAELAINITDGKLFYKDNAGVVQVIGWKVVPATAGGTGQTSYAVGDILYANTTTTLAKLADVATGNALISGGVGVAPSWGKIGLTTHVTGTLPTANGGTNLTSFTANGVLYASSTSALATSANLLYDGSFFGIGPAGITPAYAFQVSNTSGELVAFYNNRTSSGGANFRLFKSRGSFASPTVAVANDDIGTIQFRVYARNSGNTADEYVDSARISTYVSAVDAQNRVSSAIGFWTGTASAGITRKVVIDNAGNLLINTATAIANSKVTLAGNFAFSGTGSEARIRNETDGVSVSTTATTIVQGGDIGQFNVVNGISGGDRFCDLVLSSSSVSPVVVQSFTALGSPVARTYTRSGTDLQVAMASGTYTVRVVTIGK